MLAQQIQADRNVETPQERIDHLQQARSEIQVRLDELDGYRWLSAEEQLERKRCQKMKLAMKDEIESLRRQLSP